MRSGERSAPSAFRTTSRGRAWRSARSTRPVDPPAFPEYWEPREYHVTLLWRGVLPIGRQVIGIQFPPPEGETRFVRDDGRSALIRRWDHLISISPRMDGRSDYVDRLDVEAGPLTPIVAGFAKSFYAHRQAQWRRLAGNGFDYEA